MKKLGMILSSIMFLSSIGCATAKTGVARQAKPSAFDETEMERIRFEKMLMLNEKHIQRNTREAKLESKFSGGVNDEIHQGISLSSG